MEDETPNVENDEVRVLAARLARPHRSGGTVIERAAILAEGGRSVALMEWIVAHDGQPEAVEPVAARGGLHSARVSDAARASIGAPRRYVLPPGAV